MHVAGEPIGRRRELDLITAALAPESPEGQALVLLGDAGVGKTLLLQAIADQARAQGRRVLRSRGDRGEIGLPFAALHQLLGPALRLADGLADAQRAAVRAAFGEAEPATGGGEAQPPDAMMLRLGFLSLVSRLADDGPILLLADDLQWMDPASCDVLAFLARRLEGEPIALLAAVRGDRVPAGLQRALPSFRIEPLGPADSAELLSRQPVVLPESLRARVLEQAAGNPLALVELPRVVTGDGPPVSRRVEDAFAAQLAGLPEPTRRALLTAAAAGTADLSTMTAALAEPYAVWAPAEQAALIRLHDGRLEFRHPLVASAVYGAAPFAERRAVHLALARVEQDSDRRVSHLSAAAVGPDEQTAALLEAASERARLRGALTEAVAGLERAAQLSPDLHEQGRRLSVAAVVAFVAGDVVRAQDVAARAATLTDDPVGQAWLDQLAGTAASMTLRMEQAFEQVLPASPDQLPAGDQAFYLLTVAAHIAYYTNRPDHHRRLAAVCPPASAPLTVYQQWIRWVLDPFGQADSARALLPSVIAALRGDPAEQNLTATLAMRVDATEIAINLLDAVAHPDRADAARVMAGTAAADRAWALFDAGRWPEARTGAAALVEDSRQAPAQISVTNAQIVLGSLAAASGDTAEADRLLQPILNHSVAARIQAFTVRARWATGLTALARRDHESAYTALRPLFDDIGNPVHPHLCSYYVGDFAVAAARTDRRDIGRTVTQRIRRLAGQGASPRLRQLWHRADAHLGSPADAEQHFHAALGQPDADRWAFEHAVVRLEYGEWLRRRRRVTDSRTQLTPAIQIFDRLGAAVWADRGREELRATGVTAPAPRRDTLGGFSPRTQQVLRLAAQGMTNPQIAEQLYLSPRTVSSHLYRSFPKLGITQRGQLRDVIWDDRPEDV
ncbi:transcriptional regulator [Actinoplanes palleronii]|uniref:Transcriptional regulator n=2 Tax=Actinoplanes palleronii TaxID=113570 RepID=A0ABQ4BFP1_9ACTN|nr:transcriptional regulator [Actinoplanes palleronii]